MEVNKMMQMKIVLSKSKRAYILLVNLSEYKIDPSYLTLSYKKSPEYFILSGSLKSSIMSSW